MFKQSCRGKGHCDDQDDGADKRFHVSLVRIPFGVALHSDARAKIIVIWSSDFES